MLRSPTMLRRGKEVMKLNALSLRQCAAIANDHLDVIISVDTFLSELEISVCCIQYFPVLNLIWLYYLGMPKSLWYQIVGIYSKAFAAFDSPYFERL